MELLYAAVRTALTDATLNAIVPVADIATKYAKETANYPCINLALSGSGTEISGMRMATLKISVFSSVNRQQLWSIYTLVRGLLHDQERSVTTASRIIHRIFESAVDDDMYDRSNGVWMLGARYTIIFSTASVLSARVTDGVICAHASAVTKTTEIAKFRGRVELDVSFRGSSRTEMERFRKSPYYHSGLAMVTMSEVVFKAASLNLIWNITYSASGTLNDGETAATTYTITQSSVPREMQILFHATKVEDGKILEIESDKAVCEQFRIPFSRSDLTVHDCRWMLFGDSGGNVVKVSIEN